MLKFRKSREDEFLKVYEFISNCEGLENYFAHFYKIMLRYFGNSCFIAEDSDSVVGVVMGFFSQQHESTYFLWQIGVSPEHQGKGIGKNLLQYVEQELANAGIRRIEVTIDPENIPSKKAFDKSGYTNISEQIGETITVNGNTAVKDHYSPGRHFMVYEKNL